MLDGLVKYELGAAIPEITRVLDGLVKDELEAAMPECLTVWSSTSYEVRCLHVIRLKILLLLLPPPLLLLLLLLLPPRTPGNLRSLDPFLLQRVLLAVWLTVVDVLLALFCKKQI